MEEGTPPPSAASRPPLPHPPASSSAVAPDHPSPLTYIVQAPKDQIYRIPPEENARLAAQYHARHASLRKKRSPCLLFLLRFLCLVISVAFLLLAAALIFAIVARPTAPVFNIDRIATHPCEIFMEVTNPSIGMGYSIEESVGRGARLSYKGKNVADGEFAQLNLKAKESRRFRLVLRGVKKAALEESLRGSKKAVQLRLMVATRVWAEVRGLRLWRMKMKVECDLRVRSSGKGTKVLAQECKVSIEFW